MGGGGAALRGKFSKKISFGTLSSGINNKIKQMEWESVAEAGNAVGS